MAILYYNAAVDNDWATLGNWWTDIAFTTPASSLPTSSDDVKIYSNINSNAGSTPTVNSMVVYGNNSSIVVSINMTCVTFCEFIDESILGNGITITASSGIFGGISYGNGYVDGTFTGISYLYGSSAIRNGGIINGTTYFNNGSDINSGGTLNGSGIFIDDGGPKDNNGTINGYASGVFNNDSGGVINGNAVFLSGNSVTGRNGSGGTVNGSGTFYNDTINAGGTINFAATFYNTSRNAGVIGTNATFNNSSYNFNDIMNSWYGSVNGNATFNDSSYNDSASVNGTATFNNTSFNAGIITGLATFNNSSYNSIAYVTTGNIGGKCNGGATYNHDSYQESALNDSPGTAQYSPFTFGTATFRDRSVNKGQCPGTVVFAHGKGVNGSSILGII